MEGCFALVGALAEDQIAADRASAPGFWLEFWSCFGPGVEQTPP